MEGCIGNGELVLGAELDQVAPIVITVTKSVPMKDSFLGNRVPSSSRVEVPKDKNHVICRVVVRTSAYI